jgi:hypothetical protein
MTLYGDLVSPKIVEDDFQCLDRRNVDTAGVSADDLSSPDGS